MIIVYNIKMYLSSSMEDNAKSMGDRRKIKKVKNVYPTMIIGNCGQEIYSCKRYVMQKIIRVFQEETRF